MLPKAPVPEPPLQIVLLDLPATPAYRGFVLDERHRRCQGLGIAEAAEGFQR